MTLDQLEMLEAILETGSFKGAAQKLHKSQPSISMGIKKMEEYLGIRLFSREAYRPVLTKEGQALFEASQPVLANYRRMIRLGRELASGREAKIVVAIDPLVRRERLMTALRGITEKHPDLEVHILWGTLEENAELLIKGEASLAIGLPHGQSSHLFDQKPYGRVGLVPCVHKQKTEGEVPQIIVKAKGPELFKQSQTGGSKWYVNSHSLKEELILEGLGWGRVCEEFMEIHESQLRKVPPDLAEASWLDFHLLRHSQKPLGPIGRDLWQKLREMD